MQVTAGLARLLTPTIDVSVRHAVEVEKDERDTHLDSADDFDHPDHLL
jgi:hypothetical protein